MLERLRVQRWTDFAKAVKAGASMGRVAATVLDRQERRTKTGNKMGILALSDQSGHFEAILFQEGLNTVSRPAGTGPGRRADCPGFGRGRRGPRPDLHR